MESPKHSLIPSFLYSSPRSLLLDQMLNSKPNLHKSPSPPTMLSQKHFLIASPTEPGKGIEMYSPAFYAACTFGGILSCGLTHMAVTPLDLVKCNMQVDSLCAAFLWKNKVTSAVGARVAWNDVCKPKEEGGLGLRLLEEFAIVFQLKLIWNLFTSAGSLWVAWTKAHIFQRNNYWTLEDSPRLSRTFKSMIRLKPYIVDFMRCEVNNGMNVSFWFDSWTDLGPLINFIGANGPRDLRIRKEAYVADAVRNGDWWMPGARSDDQTDLMITQTTITPPLTSNGQDIYLWRRSSGSFAQSFSSKETWEQLRLHSPPVPWHKVVWFKEDVPRFSFITWLVMKERLPTRDRLRSWGLNVPPDCVLCSNGSETHHHLFFECSYSAAVWQAFASRIWASPPSTISAIYPWIMQTRTPPNGHATTLIKLILQVTTYLTWRERNDMIFNDKHSSSRAMQAAVDHTIRDRLLSFPSPSSHPSLLAAYFGCINFPF